MPCYAGLLAGAQALVDALGRAPRHVPAMLALGGWRATPVLRHPVVQVGYRREAG